jgi:hypothetical protein
LLPEGGEGFGWRSGRVDDASVVNVLLDSLRDLARENIREGAGERGRE